MAPLPPDFDLYEALEVPRDASAQDIVAAYHRLALVHHPDRNLEDGDAAKVSFQRLQQAYEILSDEQKRSEYDLETRLSPLAGANQPHRPPAYNEGDADDEEAGTFDPFSNPILLFAVIVTGPLRFPNVFVRMRQEVEAAREAERAAFQAEKAQRDAAEEARREAKAKEKKEKEDAAAALKEETEREESAKMEKIFAENGCATDKQKQAVCEHCSFWPKEQMKKKFKCDICEKKRGVTQFKCSYCGLVICQNCLVTKRFTKTA